MSRSPNDTSAHCWTAAHGSVQLTAAVRHPASKSLLTPTSRLHHHCAVHKHWLCQQASQPCACRVALEWLRLQRQRQPVVAHCCEQAPGAAAALKPVGTSHASIEGTVCIKPRERETTGLSPHLARPAVQAAAGSAAAPAPLCAHRQLLQRPGRRPLPGPAALKPLQPAPQGGRPAAPFSCWSNGRMSNKGREAARENADGAVRRKRGDGRERAAALAALVAAHATWTITSTGC